VHEALMLFERAATLRPRFDDALNGQVVALARLGRTAQAIDVAQQAVRAGASAAELHGNLGLMLMRSGRADEAWARLEQASRLDPDNSTWTVALARRPAAVPANVAQAPDAAAAAPAATALLLRQAAPALRRPVPGAPVAQAAPGWRGRGPATAPIAVAPAAPVAAAPAPMAPVAGCRAGANRPSARPPCCCARCPSRNWPLRP
jgi:tetratricopeptide (TPR) repeat protein